MPDEAPVATIVLARVAIVVVVVAVVVLNREVRGDWDSGCKSRISGAPRGE
jgi:hypothetical protein